MSSPPISVVMPVYNGERFVAEAIESILNQTLGDFEFIIVDDGSTDNTASILESYRRDTRVIVRRQPRNMGVREALNTGCRLARGHLVARMDADDISLPNRFARQREFLDAHPEIGVLGTGLQVINQDGQSRGVSTYQAEPALVAWLMLFVNCLAHPTVMMRRQLLEEAGYYPAGRLAEDYALFLTLSRRTRMTSLPSVHLHYRVWGQNVTHQKYDALERDAADSLREAVKSWWSIDLTEAQAMWIRGLSTDRYPQSVLDARTTCQLVGRLLDAFIEDTTLSRPEIKAVKRDAAVRMWLLAAITFTRSPVRSAKMALTASRISTASPVAFGRKAVARLANKLGRK